VPLVRPFQHRNRPKWKRVFESLIIEHFKERNAQRRAVKQAHSVRLPADTVP
jgi:hypothetical protein